MTNRYEYFLHFPDLDQLDPPATVDDLHVRAPEPEDINALAELMIEAYRGTIDYDGETLEDAVGEVRAYLSGERGGQPMLNESRLIFADTLLVGACLTADWQERQSPLIAYVMTRAEWKNRGIGKQLLRAVLQTLYKQSHTEVRAVITEGNYPSERLFGGMGFQKV
jgi:RimJ/RimL family protein N-acetyltransferase